MNIYAAIASCIAILEMLFIIVLCLRAKKDQDILRIVKRRTDDFLLITPEEEYNWHVRVLCNASERFRDEVEFGYVLTEIRNLKVKWADHPRLSMDLKMITKLAMGRANEIL